MILLDDRTKGVRLELEVLGSAARFTLELPSAPRENREAAAVSLRVLVEAIAHRLPGRSIVG